MFTTFNKEQGLLEQNLFMKDEVQFNLFHMILEANQVLALTDQEQHVMAVQNPGFKMWLWVNPNLAWSTIEDKLLALAEDLKEHSLLGVAGSPTMAKCFADFYVALTGLACQPEMSMESYVCENVRLPQEAKGGLRPAVLDDVPVIANFCAGFLEDAFGKIVSAESQISTAERLVSKGNPYLWQTGDKIVSMANISHRSPRHARINQVYTPILERKKGYASALVAAVSKQVLKEGLRPMLYADLKNPDSNKVYQSIGYTPAGRIDEFIFK